MSDVGSLFLDKARESLAGVESEYVNGRYNNAADRSSYGCFQAAIAALDRAGIRPTGSGGQWGHGFVQAQFVGLLINRRKLYAAELREALGQTLRTRVQADYEEGQVNQRQVARAVGRVGAMVVAVGAQGGSRR